MKIHRKRYGHEAQLIRGTKCRRDEIKLLNYFVCLFLKKNVLFQLNIWNLSHIFCTFLFITKTRLFKYIEIFISKNWKFSDKKLWYFSYFCSKHRLWVLIRTASARRFERVPTIYVLSRNKKNNVYPCKPQFYCIKVGFKGVKII